MLDLPTLPPLTTESHVLLALVYYVRSSSTFLSLEMARILAAYMVASHCPTLFVWSVIAPGVKAKICPILALIRILDDAVGVYQECCYTPSLPPLRHLCSSPYRRKASGYDRWARSTTARRIG